MNTLIYLIAGHYLADYGLQSTYIATEKGNSFHVMTAHCAMQALTVLLATQMAELAIAEFFLHYLTDTLKVKGKIGLHFDQAMHLTCRLTYAWLAYRYGVRS